MYEQLNKRLEELYNQFEQGNIKLIQAERESKELRETLFRIQGAIQVLEEMSGQDNQQNPSGNFVEKTAEVRIPAAPDEQVFEDK